MADRRGPLVHGARRRPDRLGAPVRCRAGGGLPHPGCPHRFPWLQAQAPPHHGDPPVVPGRRGGLRRCAAELVAGPGPALRGPAGGARRGRGTALRAHEHRARGPHPAAGHPPGPLRQRRPDPGPAAPHPARVGCGGRAGRGRPRGAGGRRPRTGSRRRRGGERPCSTDCRFRHGARHRDAHGGGARRGPRRHPGLRHHRGGHPGPRAHRRPAEPAGQRPPGQPHHRPRGAAVPGGARGGAGVR